jgi:hypothetical protein
VLELKVYDRGNEVVLTLEHSLLSLSKWESKFKKPFLQGDPKTSDELLEYYRCMLTSPEHHPDLLYRLSPAQMEQLEKYLSDPMTATKPPPPDPDGKKHTGEILTSEIIYYQMTELRINWEAQTWHLNRLMMLIAHTAHRKQPPKKESKGSALSRWQEMNQRNRERFKSKG